MVGFVVDEVLREYIEGRNILDEPMIINEMYNRDKKSKTKMFFLKVDFDKAFDSINWNYLDSVTTQMGFGDKWGF